mgnify:CR=1 FL=1
MATQHRTERRTGFCHIGCALQAHVAWHGGSDLSNCGGSPLKIMPPLWRAGCKKASPSHQSSRCCVGRERSAARQVVTSGVIPRATLNLSAMKRPHPIHCYFHFQFSDGVDLELAGYWAPVCDVAALLPHLGLGRQPHLFLKHQ